MALLTGLNVVNRQLKTAVLFIVFNRIDTTKQVFESIRQAKPPRLYIAADGARSSNLADFENVKTVRDYIMDNISWDCDVKTLFRETNLGCKYAVSSAISWFFETEEMGIILEDDCLPSMSFFWYCEVLLDRYKNNDKISLISGRNNFETYYPKNAKHYFFTSRGFIWGWATWRRSVIGFNPDFINADNKDLIINDIKKKSTSHAEFVFRKNNVDAIISGAINTWDYPFNIFQLLNKRLSIVPCVNMIRNIGHGPMATHTQGHSKENIKIYDIQFPIPEEMIIDNTFSEKTMIANKFDILKKKLNKVVRFFTGFVIV